MNWSDLVTTIVLSIVGLVLPYALVLFHQWVASNVKNALLKQWSIAAAVAAGRAYGTLMKLKESNPTTPMSTLMLRAATEEGAMFFATYKEKAAAIGATPADAATRVRGELGKLLAADPNITVEPVALVVPKVELVEVPPTPKLP